MSARLAGKIAIVSGAAQGMGAATARIFAEQGASVVLMDIKAERGAACAQKIGSQAAFVDGDRFDVTRKIDHHLAFGYGLHFCLGAALARLEGRVALDEVLQRFPSWEVDWDNAKQARTSAVRGWERLPVRTP